VWEGYGAGRGRHECCAGAVRCAPLRAGGEEGKQEDIARHIVRLRRWPCRRIRPRRGLRRLSPGVFAHRETTKTIPRDLGAGVRCRRERDRMARRVQRPGQAGPAAANALHQLASSATRASRPAARARRALSSIILWRGHSIARATRATRATRAVKQQSPRLSRAVARRRARVGSRTGDRCVCVAGIVVSRRRPRPRWCASTSGRPCVPYRPRPV